MITRLPQALVQSLTPLLGAVHAERVVARCYAVLYLVYYYLSAQYARALLGIAWLVVTPLLFLAVYLPVLTYVFNAKLPGAAGPYDYALFIVAGFLPWAAFSDGFGQGAASIVNGASIVRHAPMPPSLLPAIRVSGAFTGLLVGLLIYLPILTALGRFPGLRLVLLPPAFVLLYGFTLGVSWLTSSLAVYVRDILQLLPTLLLIEFFACPIVYPPSLVPPALKMFVGWNPLTPFLALFRASVAPTAEFAWLDLGLATAWTVGALALGSLTFRRLEGGFGDAL
jgi:lipopolysaccharide transport system permease protein